MSKETTVGFQNGECFTSFIYTVVEYAREEGGKAEMRMHVIVVRMIQQNIDRNL